ncbi:iron chelate uptake ABC transporter family permease subunit [Culicoidibacter larvae]|uniref:Iron ABC transporter permease n=1 Tax=Culicoidibacter larvae TaxID=2579976 RepID=A0A5R8QBC2_9FIRM|nr:iron chelate uptake ABC transporter family permease subunit [Culicoidibacter larvae]TLG73879.1 iron ABC transporter permease [Culicoidibacter larvae]
MKLDKKIALLAVVAVLLCALYLVWGLNSGNWDYLLAKRMPKLIAILAVGSAIALASLLFQTITNNRVLTPSILGLDSVYLFFQTLLIFIFGSAQLTFLSDNINFLLSTLIMTGFSLLLYKFMFKQNNQNIYFLLLVGIVLGTFFRSAASFMQMLIDPNEYLHVQDKMFASFNNVNEYILIVAIAIMLLTLPFIADYIRSLDVMLLGKDQAVNLGVDYEKISRRILIIVSILTAVATALVGPILFLGLLVVNISFEFLKTYKHTYLLVAGSLLAVIALIGGQLIIERIFNFSVTLSVVINFVGGIYFVFLLLKERNT